MNLPDLDSEFEDFLKRLKRNQVRSFTSSFGASVACYDLGNALKGNKSLVDLNLGFNKITISGAEFLAQGLKSNRTLARLNLRGNAINDGGTCHLAEALKYNQTLVMLNLHSNFIRSDGARALSEALILNHGLVELILRSNNIGNDGAAFIAEGLESNKTLAILDLFENGIGDVGCERLAGALKQNSTLVELSLQANNLGNEGAWYFADGIDYTGRGTKSSLRILNLSFTRIDDEGARYLLDALNTNKRLIELKLDDNRISVLILAQISAEIKMNKMQMRDKHKNTFLDVLNSSNKASWNRSRLMLVGQGKAGKTATGKDFSPDWDSTIGANVSESEIGAARNIWPHNNVKNVGENIASKFAARIMMNKQRSSIRQIAMEDGELEETPNRRRSVMKMLRSSIPGGSMRRKSIRGSLNLRRSMRPNMRQSVRGNSTQVMNRLSERPLQTKKASKSRNHSKAEFSQLSATKSNIVRVYDPTILLDAATNADTISITLWDFGGQEVFYSMHHIFLTKTGVYLVVFDMREVADSTTLKQSLKYISFWLRSIRLHAPDAPTFLVGTFWDSIDPDQESTYLINDSIKSVVNGRFPQIVLNDEEGLLFYPVDNKSGSGISALRCKVEWSVRYDKYVAQRISVKWILFLDEILSRQEEDKFLTLPEVQNIANKIGLIDAVEQDEALKLFHERGMILHLTATETLRNIIILKADWLIDALSKVIRDGEIHEYDMRDLLIHGLVTDFQLLRDKALVTRDFLEYVWTEKYTDFFLDFMKRTMLLSPWDFGSRKGERFLIPSMLKQNHNVRLPERISCIFDFSDSFLPNGVFQRLLCLFIAHSASFRSEDADNICKEPTLFQTYGSIEYQPGSIVSLFEDSERQRIIVSIEENKLAQRILGIIRSMLWKLNSDVMNDGLKWEVLVQARTKEGTPALMELSEAIRQSLSPWYDEEVTNGSDVHSKGADLEMFLANL